MKRKLIIYFLYSTLIEPRRFKSESSRTLRKKCPYSEIFWSVFSSIRTEYREILRISAYSVWMWENAAQNNSEYGHFSRRNVNILVLEDYLWNYLAVFFFVFDLPLFHAKAYHKPITSKWDHFTKPFDIVIFHGLLTLDTGGAGIWIFKRT